MWELKSFYCIDYRTVTGVNGPLVILDNVKVSWIDQRAQMFTL